MCEEIGGHGQAQELIGSSPEETLRAIAMHGLRRVTESIQRRILQRVVAESNEFPELGRKFWEEGPGRIQAVLARYLEEATRQGVLTVGDPAQVAELLVGQITGLYLLPMLAGVRKRPTEDEMRRDVDRVVAGFMSYSKATR